MVEVAETVEDLDEVGLEKSLAYCDKMIEEGDELGFFAMVKKTLLSEESKFEEWNNGRIEL